MEEVDFESLELKEKIKKYFSIFDWDCISQPQMISLSFCRKEEYDYYLNHSSQAPRREMPEYSLLIDELRQLGFNAVDIQSPEAANPSTLVVSARGIRTPFLPADKVKKVAKQLVTTLLISAYVRPLSLPHPLGFEQQGDFLDSSMIADIDIPFNYKHPFPQRCQAILTRYGANFVRQMVDYAYDHRQSSKWLRELEFNQKEPHWIMMGKTNAVNPIAKNPFNSDEGKECLYGSTGFDNAVKFSGLQFNAWKEKPFAFMDIYLAPPSQQYTKEFGLEVADIRTQGRQQNFETPINSAVNSHISTFMLFDKGDMYFEIPREQPQWQAFCELFRASHNEAYPQLKARYEACLAQLEDNNGQLQCYDLYGRKYDMKNDFSLLQQNHFTADIGRYVRRYDMKSLLEKVQIIKSENGIESPLNMPSNNLNKDFAGSLQRMKETVIATRNKFSADNDIEMPPTSPSHKISSSRYKRERQS